METQKVENLLNSSEHEYSNVATKKSHVLTIHMKIQSNF